MSKAIRANSEAIMELKRSAFTPSAPEKSPTSLLEDMHLMNTKMLVNATSRCLESCYSIFKPIKPNEDVPIRYSSTLARGSTVTLADNKLPPTRRDLPLSGSSFLASHQSIPSPANSPTTSPEEGLAPNAKPEEPRSLSTRNYSPEEIVIPVPTEHSGENLASLVNFQKYLDIQDVILDMVELSGVDISNYRDTITLRKLPPGYVADDVYSKPFMRCVIEVAEKCDVDLYFSMPVSDSTS